MSSSSEAQIQGKQGGAEGDYSENKKQTKTWVRELLPQFFFFNLRTYNSDFTFFLAQAAHEQRLVAAALAKDQRLYQFPAPPAASSLAPYR